MFYFEKYDNKKPKQKNHMEWAIEILNDKLRQINDAYEKFVVNGSADANSVSAIENRKKAAQLNNAINILRTNVDTLRLNPVIKSVCLCKYGFKKKNYDECAFCGGKWSGRKKQTGL